MMQKLYQLWVVLLVIAGGVTACFFGFAVSELWKFFTLNQSVPAKATEMEVLSLPSSRFAILIHYSYEVDGVSYKGETILSSPQFLNRFSAQNYIPFILSAKWKSHYDQKQPSYSCLEHDFPYEECIQALVTLSVFLYFYFAKGLLTRYLKILPQQYH